MTTKTKKKKKKTWPVKDSLWASRLHRLRGIPNCSYHTRWNSMNILRLPIMLSWQSSHFIIEFQQSISANKLLHGLKVLQRFVEGSHSVFIKITLYLTCSLWKLEQLKALSKLGWLIDSIFIIRTFCFHYPHWIWNKSSNSVQNPWAASWLSDC